MATTIIATYFCTECQERHYDFKLQYPLHVLKQSKEGIKSEILNDLSLRVKSEWVLQNRQHVDEIDAENFVDELITYGCIIQ